MQWIWICCLLFASANHAISANRSRRDLWAIKNHISSKLFGTETIVIQLPKMSKDENYQLFRIKGHDDILLKVSRKPETVVEKLDVEKANDPVIVSPELAIVGNYLGTSTQSETLQALQIANNLIKSGIVSGTLPVREPVNSVKFITNEKSPIYVMPQTAERIEVLNRQPVVEYPQLQLQLHPEKYTPVVVASELKYRPLQTKYSYKQEGENADMTFESYNNQDVIVTRTEKVPIKPQYITLRLLEAASIANNPYRIVSQQTVSVITEEYLPMAPIRNAIPIAPNILSRYPVRNPNIEVVQKSDNDRNLLDIPNFVKQSNHSFDIREHLSDDEVDKLNKFINAKLNNSRNEVPQLSSTTEKPSGGNLKKEQLENVATYSNLVSRYVYQQRGDIDQDNYTVVSIDDSKLNRRKIDVASTNDEISKDYVYIPPTDINIAPPYGNSFQVVDNDYDILNIADNSKEPSLPAVTSLPTTTIKGSIFNNRVTHDAMRLSYKLSNPTTSTHVNYKENNLLTSAPIEMDNKINSPSTVAPTTVNLSTLDRLYNKNEKYLTPTPTKLATVASKNISSIISITETINSGLNVVRDDQSIVGLRQHNTAGNLKTNIRNLQESPVVVPEINDGQSNTRAFRPKHNKSNVRPFTGGQVYSK